MRTRCLVSGALVSLAVLLSIGVLPASGYSIRTVPVPYTTIQAGIDAAVPGDIVLIAAGTFTDVTHPAGAGDTTKCIAVMKSGITLSGSGVGLTTLDAGYRGRAISCSGVTGATIQSMTIQRAAAANNGAGILCTGASTPTIQNCTITNNHAPAIVCLQGSAPYVHLCELTHNTSPVAGGAIANYASSPTIRACDIAYNVSGGDGGGIYSIYPPCVVTIDSCAISANYPNRADWVGGGMAVEAGTATVSNTTLGANSCGSFGGAIYASSCQLTIQNCHILDNGVDWGPVCSGAGLYVQACPAVNIANSVFAGNVISVAGDLYGGAITIGGCPNTQIRQCTFANNGGTIGGGLYLYDRNRRHREDGQQSQRIRQRIAALKATG